MDYFKEAENLLYSVPKKEEAIGQMTKRKERLMKRVAPYFQGGEAIADPVSVTPDQVKHLNEAAELAELIKSIENEAAELAEIRSCVEAIDDAILRKLIKCWYWERLQKEKIAEEIDVWSMTTVYSRRTKAVACFAYLYWGKHIDEKVKKKARKN